MNWIWRIIDNKCKKQQSANKNSPYSSYGLFTNPSHYSLSLIQLPRHHGHLHFTDSLRDLDITRTGFSTVIRRVTARNAICLAQDLQTQIGGFIAAVEDKAMRSHDRGGTVILAIRPIRRTGGCAACAENTFCRLIKTGAVFEALQSLTSIFRQWGIIDKIWKHASCSYRRTAPYPRSDL